LKKTKGGTEEKKKNRMVRRQIKWTHYLLLDKGEARGKPAIWFGWRKLWQLGELKNRWEAVKCALPRRASSNKIKMKNPKEASHTKGERDGLEY